MRGGTSAKDVNPRRRIPKHYHTLPWLLSGSESDFMDDAQHRYGRRETWGRRYSEVPIDDKDKFDPLSTMLSYIRHLQSEGDHWRKEADYHERRCTREKIIFERWVKAALPWHDGPEILKTWLHPRLSPHQAPDSQQLPKATAEHVKRTIQRWAKFQGKSGEEVEKETLRKLGFEVAQASKPSARPTATPQSFSVPDDDDFEHMKYDPDVVSEIAADRPDPISEMPFLRMRVAERPDTLHPALTQWTRKWFPDPLEQKPMVDKPPDSPTPTPSESVLTPLPHVSLSATVPAASNQPVPKPPSPQPSSSALEKRKRVPRAPRSLEEVVRKNTNFDANRRFAKNSTVEIDWETQRMAHIMNGYDGMKALERKIRLKRGEEV